MDLRRSFLCAACLASVSTFLHRRNSGRDGTGGDSGIPSDDGGGGGGGGDGGGMSGKDADVTGPLTGNGCAGGTCQNPTCKPYATAADPGTAPETGFSPNPDFIPNDVIIPTFDDVPDGLDSTDASNAPGAWTTANLKFFDEHNLHMDFFINTNNWCGPVTGSMDDDPDCHAAILDILAKHNPGNHTIHHVHMGTPTTTPDPPDGCADAASCEAQLTGVEMVIGAMSHAGRPHLTRFRAPYGEPYQNIGDMPKLPIVAPVVAKYAVEVDWNIDSGDSTCPTPCPYKGTDILNNVTMAIKDAPGKGAWGILLMHGTYRWTSEALPMLFGPSGYLAQHGFKTGTVEDAICWKYGKHSWEIVQKISGQPRAQN